MASTADQSGATILSGRLQRSPFFEADMHIQISGQQIDIGDALRVHVVDKLNAGVGKYFDQSLDATVAFSRDGEGYACTAKVHVFSGLTLFAEARAGDIYASFDQTAERMEKRLRRHKSRIKAHKGRTAPAEDITAQYTVIDAEADLPDDHAEPPGQSAVIAEAPATVATLRVGDAVMRLDLSGAPVLMFRNAGHGGLNVVYRRPDGHIGWIDPAFDPKPA